MAPEEATRRLHPADSASLAILAVVTVTLAISTSRGADLGNALALHAALLASYAVISVALRRRPATLLRGILVVAVMFTLYTTLGHVAFAAMPWIADPWLEAADRALFLGPSPSLILAPLGATRWAEILSIFYAAFIPYLYLSIFLGLIGRPEGERSEFVTGFAVLYALSFLGYLFLPARGPIVELADQFPTPVQGGYFHALVLRSVEAAGGPHGAFPSLHVGASFYAALFDLRQGNTLRALIYAPLLVLIVLATLVLRYHYVVDLIAGVALALLASRITGRRAPSPLAAEVAS
ncbi:MAG: phosphatase PAP2 family protein [Gemmatimonadetes bacterium]|nr:phosphatase PAP2 family protein [Gemmatimonadota bacterium]